MNNNHTKDDLLIRAFTGLKQHSFKALHEALATNALHNSAGRCVVKDEPIYGKDDFIAHELLACPKNFSKEFSIGELSETAYNAGYHQAFDKRTLNNCIEYANISPFTVNISVISALSPDFFEGLIKKLEEYTLKPNDIIFEILEHNVDRNASISHLEKMKKQGFRFALDDYSNGKSHLNRLQVFGDLVDFIKIDGPLIRAALDGEYKKNGSVIATVDDYNSAIQALNDHYNNQTTPLPPLVGEFVRNRQDADRLYDMGFSGVQGRHLNSQDFAYAAKVTSNEFKVNADFKFT
ncbi:MAG: EAL domain-containing protein [Alphaproteobacteria bacterium]|nr:EAL domain-containing protein [Alphaproteobacteria bacterium]